MPERKAGLSRRGRRAYRGRMVKVLLLGAGGREHALAWKLAQSPRLSLLVSAPGNPGMARHGLVEPGLDILDGAAVARYAKERGIELVIIGPEAPLAAGVADACRAAGLLVAGPSAAAAQLEASKGFTKDICAAAGVPTAMKMTRAFSTARFKSVVKESRPAFTFCATSESRPGS